MRVRDEVLVYVTRGDQVLVLLHPDHPEAGVQVPGGGIQPGESAVEAAHREVAEETGLDGLETVGVVGTLDWDMRPYAHVVERRTYVHLRAGSAPDGPWFHEERHAEGGGPPIRFELRWQRLDGTDLGLIAGHGAWLAGWAP